MCWTVITRRDDQNVQGWRTRTLNEFTNQIDRVKSADQIGSELWHTVSSGSRLSYFRSSGLIREMNVEERRWR